MPFQIVRNTIVKVKADAIVNSANPEPAIGGGTDSAVYEAAGKEELLKERKKIGRIRPGTAVYTHAFALPAEYIIHTAGPVWVDGRNGEEETLRNCYRNSLLLAEKLGCRSIAFPLISSGSYGFPKDKALSIALEEIQAFLESHEMDVILVVFDDRSFALSRSITRRIDSYISSHEAGRLAAKEYSIRSAAVGSVFGSSCMQELQNAIAADEAVEQKDLDEVVSHAGKTFQEKLFELIDERHLDDVAVYKKANVDRKVFSRIRSNPSYHPSKKTALAFAVALELDRDEADDLLSRAGYALSPSDKSDLIVEYFMENHNYNMFDINAALFQYHLPLLG